MRRAANVGWLVARSEGTGSMTHGSKQDPNKLGALRGIGLSLGPPQAGGWSITTQEEPSPSSRDDQTPTTPQGASSGTAGPEHAAAGRSLYDAGEQFATRLQLLLTYRREIGTVARATSFANAVSIFTLLSDMVESSRDRDGTDALASFSFDLLTESEDGSVRRLSARGPIYEQHHVTAVQNRVKYHDAALRLLHETSVQQLVNSYERLIGDIARAHIFENTQKAAKDQSLTYRQILEFGSIDEVKRAVVEAQVRDLIRNSNTLEQLQWLRERLNVMFGRSSLASMRSEALSCGDMQSFTLAALQRRNTRGDLECWGRPNRQPRGRRWRCLQRTSTVAGMSYMHSGL